ncbi:SDR family NAD(P)-dependent oxidoreductase [Pseudonocardia halophobica]|uniref:SDR family NAD(P)-dependent oxidoreductase n=1 Tax=Pseudonocardia halophobica TaxID=29401 RepID=UPI003D8A798C
MPDPLDPRPLFNVDGRVIVLTGGTGGLGSATARGLAACGAHLVVVGRAADRLQEIVAGIQDTGGSAVGVTADITLAADRAAVVDTAVAEFGGIDVLINNAGVTHRVPVAELDVETYRRINGINAEAALFLAQAAYPHLKAHGNGSVVNVLSIGMWSSGANSVLYRSTKSALHGMTMVLAQESAPDGIRVNAVAPGTFEAGMGTAISADRVAAQVARTPMRRRGRPEEIVPTMLYLASDASSYVTGTTLRVDGGTVSL